jgi:hypothetical protein
MADLNEILDLRDKLQKWGQIMIKVWQDNLQKKGINASGELARSFEEKVRGQQADAMAIALKFKMYGRFRDMGVGKGVKAYERNQNAANRSAARRYGAKVSSTNITAKRWYNKPKMAQIYKLREILGIDLGTAVSDELSQIASEINNHIVNL